MVETLLSIGSMRSVNRRKVKRKVQTLRKERAKLLRINSRFFVLQHQLKQIWGAGFGWDRKHDPIVPYCKPSWDINDPAFQAPYANRVVEIEDSASLRRLLQPIRDHGRRHPAIDPIMQQLAALTQKILQVERAEKELKNAEAKMEALIQREISQFRTMLNDFSAMTPAGRTLDDWHPFSPPAELSVDEAIKLMHFAANQYRGLFALDKKLRDMVANEYGVEMVRHEPVYNSHAVGSHQPALTLHFLPDHRPSLHETWPPRATSKISFANGSSVDGLLNNSAIVTYLDGQKFRGSGKSILYQYPFDSFDFHTVESLIDMAANAMDPHMLPAEFREPFITYLLDKRWPVLKAEAKVREVRGLHPRYT